jgi:RNA polymerase sigma-70 factor (ECF subfamily)
MGNLGERLARGDQAAFAELYDACADRLHHYLVVRLQSREDADEVLQETFVRLAGRPKRLARVENLTAYVFTVARNEAARLLGRRTREREKRKAGAAADALFCEAVTHDMQAREVAQETVAALDRLDSEQREIVELKIYSGLTFREIAEVTDLPQGTVATRYRTALAKLRGWLAKEIQ